MPNDDEPKSLSYEVLEAKIAKQDEEIATLKSTIDDMKKVIKLNLSTKSGEQDDSDDKGKLSKEKFEERLKEDLGLC